MKQETTVCCLALGLAWGYLTAREQAGMLDLWREEDRER